MPRLTVRPEAELDALEAASWYESERADLGTEFLDELRTTFSRIDEGPQRFPAVFREVRHSGGSFLLKSVRLELQCPPVLRHRPDNLVRGTLR